MNPRVCIDMYLGGGEGYLHTHTHTRLLYKTRKEVETSMFMPECRCESSLPDGEHFCGTLCNLLLAISPTSAIFSSSMESIRVGSRPEWLEIGISTLILYGFPLHPHFPTSGAIPWVAGGYISKT